ncbi:MAG: HAD family hydrolase [Lachnospiraceae bacterium]|nr:HAD family hydrolase [Lachnospiraceae bacterium]
MYDEKLSYCPKAADDSIVFGRYEYSVCVNINNEIKTIHNLSELKNLDADIEAVIFDLDDTLYSEKEYMRSGFHVIADYLKQVDHCFNKLCVAFEKGKMPIETLLQEENIYTEELLTECLKLFREHKPDIHLYEEVQELFLELHRQKKLIGIITDGKTVKQNAKIDSLGLRSMVDEIIITDELAGHGNPKEFRKPNDLAYLIMRKRLGIACRNMLFVGNERDRDFIAPEKVGMKCCWFENGDGLYE